MLVSNMRWTVMVAVAFGFGWGCWAPSAVDPEVLGSPEPGSTQTADPNQTANSNGATGAGSDLSCDLARLLAERCQSCHGTNRVKGADTTLLTRADLLAPSPDDSSRRVIDDVLVRMKDTQTPMPPSPDPKPTASEIALVDSWIAAGTPAQSCGVSETPPVPPRAADPYDTPTVCTSQKTWTQGDRGSDEMYPGTPCIDCHKSNFKTLFKAAFDVAGTVYPTPHEPDNCYGVSTAVTVVITDANNVVYSLPVNAAGNFSHETTLGLAGKIAMPYRAKVVRNGVEKVMKDPQTNGDCNACHTEQGTNPAASGKKAFGRIFAP